MKYFIIILLLAAVTNLPAKACLNEMGESKNIIPNVELGTDPVSYVPIGKSFADTTELKRRLKNIYNAWKFSKEINRYSDYGVLLVYLGRYEEAKRVFEEIEKIKPGRYTTAANLGTVYELLGDNQQALTWISRGVSINPRSHQSSEWMHVNILKAKVAADQDKNYLQNSLTSNVLINTDFGTDSLPKTALDSSKVFTLRNAIFYQLRERVAFIKSKDPIMAQLLFDLGNGNLLLKDYAAAYEVYQMARNYGFSQPVLDKRIATVFSLKPDLKPKTPVATAAATPTPATTGIKKYSQWAWGGAGLLLLLGLFWWKTRR